MSDQNSLFYACSEGLTEIVTLLLQDPLGIDLNQKNLCSRSSPLMLAVQYGHTPIVKLLLENHANLDDVENYHGNSILCHAIHFNQENIALMLIDYNCDYNQKNNYGNTPLHMACLNNQKKLVKKLISLNVEVNAVNNNSATPLLLCCEKKNKIIASYLLECDGIKIDTCDINGETPLMIAIRKGEIELIELLLSHGSNSNHSTKNGKNCLHISCSLNRESTEVVRALLKRGININAEDTDDRKPIYYAIDKGHINIVKALLTQHCVVDNDSFILAMEHGLAGIVILLLPHVETNVIENHVELTDLFGRGTIENGYIGQFESLAMIKGFNIKEDRDRVKKQLIMEGKWRRRSYFLLSVLSLYQLQRRDPDGRNHSSSREKVLNIIYIVQIILSYV